MANKIPTPDQAMIEKLPSELIQEILSRLPIDSVFESKYVSHKFRNLINHHRFPEMHYNQSIRNLTQQSCSLLLGGSTFHYIPDLNTSEKVIEMNGNKIPFKSFLPLFNIVGSVHGFVCLEDHSIKQYSIRETQGTPCVVICNPIKGDWLKLPDIPKLGDGMHNFFGFGYCSKSCKYKVVRMGVEEKTGNSTVEVVTVGDDSWRSIGTFTNIACKVVRFVNQVPREPNVSYVGVFLNGYIHWLMLYNHRMDGGIRAFDVEDERFVMVPFPDSFDDKEIRVKMYMGLLHLGVLGGCLMLVDHSKKLDHEIWIMKEYGVKESWVLEYVIPRDDIYSHFLQPLGVRNNGEVFAYNYGDPCYHFYYCDPENETVEKLRLLKNRMRQSLVHHVGTLVSLKDVIGPFNQPSRNF